MTLRSEDLGELREVILRIGEAGDQVGLAAVELRRQRLGVVDHLVRSVDPMLRENEPLDAFRVWARRLAAYARMKHGLGEALTSPAAQEAISATWAPVSQGVSQLLAAAAARRDVREGIDPADVILLLSALWRVPPGDAGLAQADRLLEMIITSLQHEPGMPA